mgnify:CR=1 FL=1
MRIVSEMIDDIKRVGQNGLGFIKRFISWFDVFESLIVISAVFILLVSQIVKMDAQIKLLNNEIKELKQEQKILKIKAKTSRLYSTQWIIDNINDE